MSESFRVWDGPLRLFHWLLAASVGGALLTGWLGGNLMPWHGRLGLAVLGLLVFRLLWGFWGSGYARWRYLLATLSGLRDELQGRWRRPGHSPAGVLAVLALLGLLALQLATGLLADDEIAFHGPLQPLASPDTSQALTRLHRQLWPWLLGMISLHLLAILFYVRIRRRPLLRAMLTGQMPKTGAGQQDARGGGWSRASLALLLAALLVMAVQMWPEWRVAVAPPAAGAPDW